MHTYPPRSLEFGLVVVQNVLFSLQCSRTHAIETTDNATNALSLARLDGSDDVVGSKFRGNLVRRHQDVLPQLSGTGVNVHAGKFEGFIVCGYDGDFVDERACEEGVEVYLEGWRRDGCNEDDDCIAGVSSEWRRGRLGCGLVGQLAGGLAGGLASGLAD